MINLKEYCKRNELKAYDVLPEFYRFLLQVAWIYLLTLLVIKWKRFWIMFGIDIIISKQLKFRHTACGIVIFRATDCSGAIQYNQFKHRVPSISIYLRVTVPDNVFWVASNRRRPAPCAEYNNTFPLYHFGFSRAVQRARSGREERSEREWAGGERRKAGAVPVRGRPCSRRRARWAARQPPPARGLRLQRHRAT